MEGPVSPGRDRTSRAALWGVDNRNVLRDEYQAFATGDLAHLGQLLADDIVWQALPQSAVR